MPADPSSSSGERLLGPVWTYGPAALLLLADDATCLEVNPAFAALTGLAAGDLDVEDLEDARSEAAAGTPTEAVARFRRADGGELEARLRLLPVHDLPGAGAGKLVLAMVDDRAALARTEVALERAVERADMLFEEGPAGNVESTLDGRVIRVNGSYAALMGFEPEELIGRRVADLATPESEEAVAEAMRGLSELGKTYTVERLHRHSDGGLVPLLISVGTLPDASGTTLDRIVGFVVDQSTQHAQRAELADAEQRAREAGARFEAMLAASPDYTFVLDLRDGDLVYGAPGKDVAGYSSDELHEMGATAVTRLVPEPDQQKLRALNLQAADTPDGVVLQLRYRARHRDGSLRWLHRRVTPFRRGETGRVVEVLGVLRDITEQVETEERLQHAALYDVLTGLPNRALLADRLQAALERSRETGNELAVLFFDLDGFKLVNDRAGHASGDEVLRVIGRRLRGLLRSSDTVARVGGDEFVLVLEPLHRSYPSGVRMPGDPGVRDRSLATEVAARLASEISEPVVVDGMAHRVTPSIGIAFVGGAGLSHTADEVLREADAAMYQAKLAGKDRAEVVDLT